jgi:hypothetical protein
MPYSENGPQNFEVRRSNKNDFFIFLIDRLLKLNNNYNKLEKVIIEDGYYFQEKIARGPGIIKDVYTYINNTIKQLIDFKEELEKYKENKIECPILSNLYNLRESLISITGEENLNKYLSNLNFILWQLPYIRYKFDIPMKDIIKAFILNKNERTIPIKSLNELLFSEGDNTNILIRNFCKNLLDLPYSINGIPISKRKDMISIEEILSDKNKILTMLWEWAKIMDEKKPKMREQLIIRLKTLLSEEKGIDIFNEQIDGNKNISYYLNEVNEHKYFTDVIDIPYCIQQVVDFYYKIKNRISVRNCYILSLCYNRFNKNEEYTEGEIFNFANKIIFTNIPKELEEAFKKLIINFKDGITDNLKELPLDNQKDKPLRNIIDKYRDHNDFFEKLLIYWGASNSIINENPMYNISGISDFPFRGIVPHTCFRQIEIGTNLKDFSQDALLQEVDNKIYTESRMDIWGGSRKTSIKNTNRRLPVIRKMSLKNTKKEIRKTKKNRKIE